MPLTRDFQATLRVWNRKSSCNPVYTPALCLLHGSAITSHTAISLLKGELLEVRHLAFGSQYLQILATSRGSACHVHCSYTWLTCVEDTPSGVRKRREPKSEKISMFYFLIISLLFDYHVSRYQSFTIDVITTMQVPYLIPMNVHTLSQVGHMTE